LVDNLLKTKDKEIVALDKLLTYLHQDREQAGKLYQDIYIKITRYFQSQGCPDYQECAHLTMERVGLKLLKESNINNIGYAYFRSVAYYVLLEYWRSKEQFVESIENLPAVFHPTVHPDRLEQEWAEYFEQELCLECLEKCLKSLSAESYELFIEYHKDRKELQVDHRMMLAKQLGIDIAALRNRITRIRARLEKCINDCRFINERGKKK
jgi:DNA-directed RNA polymerase specialized sigma24 family protein